MSDIGMDELPEDVAKLLGDSRALHGPSDAIREKMRHRLVAALPPPPLPGGGGGTGAAGSEVVKSAGVSMLPRAPLWVVAATFVVGVATGAWVRPTSGVSRAPTATVRSEALTITTSAPIAPIATNATSTRATEAMGTPSLTPADLQLVGPQKLVASTAPATAPAPSSLAARGSGDLAAERAMLDVARTALGRGDAENALLATGEHGKKFPRGALSEEREAIAVQALAQAGRLEEAKERAQRFKRAHPESILLPAVLAAGGVP